MNIAFFSESNFDGKIPRDFKNMRTEYAWYTALDSTHHHIGKLPDIKDKTYDLGIVIIPKMNIEQLMQFPLIEQMKRVCKKIGFMQEGPHWYFQDYPMEQQKPSQFQQVIISRLKYWQEILPGEMARVLVNLYPVMKFVLCQQLIHHLNPALIAQKA